MKKTSNETAYEKITDLTQGFQGLEKDGGSVKIKSSGFMDLSINRLYTVNGGFVVSLTHYFEQNGDLVPDPDLEIFVSDATRTAWAMAIQHSTGHYAQGMKIENGQFFKAPRVQRDIQSFLGQWLRNLKAQGFYKAPIGLVRKAKKAVSV